MPFALPSLGQLASHQVHLWHVSLAALAPYHAQLLPLLTPTERLSYERACQFQMYPPQLASRALLRKVIAVYVNTNPEAVTMSRNAHGKPMLDHYPWLQCSVSHSKTEVVFALTLNNLIGVDIEMPRSLPNYLDLAQRFLSVQEYNYLRQLSKSDGLSEFIKLWTVKEAFVKAVGFGLSYPLSDFTVIFEDDKPKIKDKAMIKETSLAQDWQCHTWRSINYSYVALVYNGTSKTIYDGVLPLDWL